LDRLHHLRTAARMEPRERAMKPPLGPAMVPIWFSRRRIPARLQT
jgi:hypothetical protein